MPSRADYETELETGSRAEASRFGARVTVSEQIVRLPRMPTFWIWLLVDSTVRERRIPTRSVSEEESLWPLSHRYVLAHASGWDFGFICSRNRK